MEKIINYLRKISFFQSVQKELESRPAGPIKITFSVIIIASFVIQTFKQFEEFRIIGFPIIAGVFIFVLAFYSIGTNILLKAHRQERNTAREVLKRIVDYYRLTLSEFKYLKVTKTYRILEDGTGICYRKFKIKSINKEIVVDEFDVGSIESDEISPPKLLSDLQLSACEIRDHGERVPMRCVPIDDSNRYKIRMLAIFDPPLKPPDILTYEINYRWENMWKKLVDEYSTRGIITTIQKTDLKVLEFILPDNYIFDGLSITKSDPDIGIRDPRCKVEKENNNQKIIWKIKHPPIGVIEYNINVKKLSNSPL